MLFSSDYTTMIDSATSTFQSNIASINPSRTISHDFFSRFRDYIYEHHRETPQISQESLKIEGGLTEDEITELTAACFLTLHSNPSLFHFSGPHFGAFGHYLSAGRKNIISSLKKTKFKEILEAQLRHRDQTLRIPTKIIISDLFGRGAIQVLDGPMGNVLKLLDGGNVKLKTSGDLRWSS